MPIEEISDAPDHVWRRGTSRYDKFGRQYGPIGRPAEELYREWRNFTKFPHFMDNVERVEELDDKTSRWTIKAPAGSTVELVTRITEDRPNEAIAWVSEPDSEITTEGKVEFIRAAPGRGTMVRLTMRYDPPGGIVGKGIAKLLQREPNDPGAPRPAPLQAIDGDRRGRDQRLAVRPRKRNPDRSHGSRRPMRALTWHGRHDVRVETVPDPEIVNPRDAILRVTSTAICGSDLHLYDGYIPTMQAGDILGHEFMGEVVEVGPKSTLKKGQRVVVPFTIACGNCFFCKKQQFAPATTATRPRRRTPRELLTGHPMGGGVRLCAPDRRLCRRPGRICPRALFRRRPDRRSRRSRGRQGAVPVRHPADRLDGARRMPRSSPATRWRSGAAARSACSPSSRRLHAWARTG